jgi:hypothetical protein
MVKKIVIEIEEQENKTWSIKATGEHPLLPSGNKLPCDDISNSKELRNKSGFLLQLVLNSFEVLDEKGYSGYSQWVHRFK